MRQGLETLTTSRFKNGVTKTMTWHNNYTGSPSQMEMLNKIQEEVERNAEQVKPPPSTEVLQAEIEEKFEQWCNESESGD